MSDLEKEIERLREDCAEAYQVVGVLAVKAGLFESDQVSKALDNLEAAGNGEPRPHSNLLPFNPTTHTADIAGLTDEQLKVKYPRLYEEKTSLRDVLDILQEEMFEVGIVASKIKRFGLHDRRPTKPGEPVSETNRNSIVQELGDVLAVIKVAQPMIGFIDAEIDAAIEIKFEKLRKLGVIE